MAAHAHQGRKRNHALQKFSLPFLLDNILVAFCWWRMSKVGFLSGHMFKCWRQAAWQGRPHDLRARTGCAPAMMNHTL